MSVRQQVVTALPEVSTRQRSADDLCIVLASDGLFGSCMDPLMSSEQVADIARRTLSEFRGTGDAENKAARRLVDCAIKECNGSDNTPVVVVTLDPPCVPPRDSGGPVRLEHVESQQSMSTASAHSPGPRFGDKLHVPFSQAYPPRGERGESSRRPPSVNLLRPSAFTSP